MTAEQCELFVRDHRARVLACLRFHRRSGSWQWRAHELDKRWRNAESYGAALKALRDEWREAEGMDYGD